MPLTMTGSRLLVSGQDWFQTLLDGRMEMGDPFHLLSIISGEEAWSLAYEHCTIPRCEYGVEGLHPESPI